MNSLPPRVDPDLGEASAAELAAGLKARAAELGFDPVGICAAVSPVGLERFRQWLASGYGGQMHYLGDRDEAYTHPRSIMEGVRSLVMLGLNYRTDEPRATSPGCGRVSRYAWGDDYHDHIRRQLKQLGHWLKSRRPGARVRGVVDTAPLLEREFAQLAGLGWIGKNTLLLNKRRGSWFFLAALLVDLELPPDEPQATQHCGTCRACLEACPTQAFVAPYVLDSRRCISYLTIELREPIPRDLRPGLGDWLFGCDVCQDVCPWNRKPRPSDEPAFAPRPGHADLNAAEVLRMDEAAFRAAFGDTPLWRPRRRGILRNAAIVLGNRPTPEALPALLAALDDDEALIRGACAWALRSYLGVAADEALRRRLVVEADEQVREEILDTLASWKDPLLPAGAATSKFKTPTRLPDADDSAGL